MSTVPSDASIYHITHVDDLARIAARGELLSDRRIIDEGGPIQMIGMSQIKRRRLVDLRAVVRWADGIERRWAVSLSNAGAYCVQFGCDHQTPSPPSRIRPLSRFVLIGIIESEEES